MQIAIRIAIILIALILIWLIRKRIKRLIFILLLLLIAFWIYWGFSPSWAARLWYNIRTFPARINGWVFNQDFLNYDKYKENIKDKTDDTLSSIWDFIDDSINTNNNSEIYIEGNQNNEKIENEVTKNNESEDFNKTDESKPSKTFSIFPTFKNKLKNENSTSKSSWNTENSVINSINKYIEKNLTDTNKIVVTVEYSEDNTPKKIILETKN